MRGEYNQLLTKPEWVVQLCNELEQVGAWETGIVSTSNRSRTRYNGTAVNVDAYGYDERQKLAVFQVRETVFSSKRFNRTHKNYFLCGYNENGNAFAHAIDSVARYDGTPEATVAKALCKVWQCTEKQLASIVRNGDVAFIPQPNTWFKEHVPVASKVLLAESHLVEGNIFESGDKLYVRGHASIAHTKGQHPSVAVEKGVYRLQVGYRAETWSFSLETHD